MDGRVVSKDKIGRKKELEKKRDRVRDKMVREKKRTCVTETGKEKRRQKNEDERKETDDGERE
jgi:hypothetical protein